MEGLAHRYNQLTRAAVCWLRATTDLRSLPDHYSVKKSAGSAFAKCQPWAASQPKSRNHAA